MLSFSMQDCRLAIYTTFLSYKASEVGTPHSLTIKSLTMLYTGFDASPIVSHNCGESVN